MTACPAVTRYGDHLYVVTLARPLRRLFRATRIMRCWRCDLRVVDPDPRPSKRGM